MKSGSAIGQQAKAVMDRGELVPDNIIISMLEGQVDRMAAGDGARAGFILDGFPRTVTQAEALDAMLARKNTPLHHVIELQVDDAALVERISGRFTCAKCGQGYHDRFKQPKAADTCDVCGSHDFVRRSDDNAETVRARLEAYHRQTAPLLPYYAANGLLRVVDGMAAMGEVGSQIETVLAGGRREAPRQPPPAAARVERGLRSLDRSARAPYLSPIRAGAVTTPPPGFGVPRSDRTRQPAGRLEAVRREQER